MGRHKELGEVLELRGSRLAKDRLAEEREAVGEVRIKAPAWLNSTARAEWRRIIGCLQGTPALAEVDQSALAALCATWAELREHEAAIRVEGAVISSERGMVRNPRCLLRDRAFDRWLVLSKSFGLTPLSRKALGHAARKRGVVDPKKALLLNKITRGDDRR